MIDIIYKALLRYFNTLSVFGYKNYVDTYKLIALLFVYELQNNTSYNQFMTEEDERIINKFLYCLYGNNCLISYPFLKKKIVAILI